jgi:5-methylcytosine-specific restriction endonuclease McrA
MDSKNLTCQNCGYKYDPKQRRRVFVFKDLEEKKKEILCEECFLKITDEKGEQS